MNADLRELLREKAVLPIPWENVLRAIDRVEGWLTLAEASLLYHLASFAQGPIVEIGAWKGRSTVALALGAQHGGNILTTIDHFMGSPEIAGKSTQGDVEANLEAAGVASVVTILSGRSADVADEIASGIGLLFVDGDHRYEQVADDLSLYLPKVAHGGIVVCHDAAGGNFPGVTRAVQEFILDVPDFRLIRYVDSALVAERIDQGTCPPKVRDDVT